MKEEIKCQTEMVMKKIDKIKSFKERVLRIKEEEFKNIKLKDKANDIKTIKEKKHKSKSKSHRDKSEKKIKEICLK